MTTGQAPQTASDGLSNVAHALRRATALYVAMSISPEGTSEETMLETADRMALWILGRAGAPPRTPTPEGGFMGADPWAGG